MQTGNYLKETDILYSEKIKELEKILNEVDLKQYFNV